MSFSSNSSSDVSDSDQLEENPQVPSRTAGAIPTVSSTSDVSVKTKKKIIKGEYIDISKLLPSLLEVEEGEPEKSKSKSLAFYE